MKLYYMKGACSLASFISLKEAGCDFDAAEVDHKTRRTRDGEDLNAVNSKGYVPVLRLDDGEFLTENVAVLLYIGDLNPSAGLAPREGTLDRYRLVETLAYINSELHKNFGPLFNPANSQDVKNMARSNLTKRLDWLEKSIGEKTFLVGDRFTVADAYLFVVLSWADRVDIDLKRWPALKRHNERVRARPQVIAALKAEGLA